MIILLSAGRKQNGKNKALLFGGPEEIEKERSNYMEFHSKVNDLDYEAVIVLSSVLSSLRNQTHERVEKALVEGCKDIQ
ncbi:hypothetical protein [Bacillus wiedmannii]|uniref:hypothetical protein n=1 Tax=Bacillus wiedmannii TaxID=1890302 RepID=UPI000872E895|nr:hypothetical protein [Bacillus wiedmannii]OFD12193.1 hypothetical protein BTGOE6_02200 [Bacillus wiedmannii]